MVGTARTQSSLRRLRKLVCAACLCPPLRYSLFAWHDFRSLADSESMNIALAHQSALNRRLFLEVEQSVCGRAWRDRLDEIGAARALAITQRHGVPDLLARILAGRAVDVDEVAAFLDPTVRASMPDPHSLTNMNVAVPR